MSVTAAGENAGQLHKAGCAAPPMAAPPMAAPPALCPRGPWSFIFEFTKTIEKHPRQNYVSWPGFPLIGVGGFWILEVLSINELRYLYPPTLRFLGVSADDDFIIT